MARARLALFLSALLCAVGVASLALTLYLWFGAWPREMKQTVDSLRSARENAGRARAGPGSWLRAAPSA